MGGTITHLIIADKIMEKLPDYVFTNQAMFLAGSLAPDAIHSRPLFVREMKKHTHLRDGIHDRDFPLPENRRLFHKRIEEFIETNCKKKGEILDACRGYICHLLADEMFILTARRKLVVPLEKKGINQRDAKFFEYFSKEVHNNDLILARSYKKINSIKNNLDKVTAFEIAGYVTSDEIRRSRNWVKSTFLLNPREPNKPEYIAPEDINLYIDKSVEYTIDYFTTKKLI